MSSWVQLFRRSCPTAVVEPVSNAVCVLIGVADVIQFCYFLEISDELSELLCLGNRVCDLFSLEITQWIRFVDCLEFGIEYIVYDSHGVPDEIVIRCSNSFIFLFQIRLGEPKRIIISECVELLVSQRQCERIDFDLADLIDNCHRFLNVDAHDDGDGIIVELG